MDDAAKISRPKAAKLWDSSSITNTCQNYRKLMLFLIIPNHPQPQYHLFHTSTGPMVTPWCSVGSVRCRWRNGSRSSATAVAEAARSASNAGNVRTFAGRSSPSWWMLGRKMWSFSKLKDNHLEVLGYSVVLYSLPFGSKPWECLYVSSILCRLNSSFTRFSCAGWWRKGVHRCSGDKMISHHPWVPRRSQQQVISHMIWPVAIGCVFLISSLLRRASSRHTSPLCDWDCLLKSHWLFLIASASVDKKRTNKKTIPKYLNRKYTDPLVTPIYLDSLSLCGAESKPGSKWFPISTINPHLSLFQYRHSQWL